MRVVWCLDTSREHRIYAPGPPNRWPGTIAISPHLTFTQHNWLNTLTISQVKSTWNRHVSNSTRNRNKILKYGANMNILKIRTIFFNSVLIILAFFFKKVVSLFCKNLATNGTNMSRPARDWGQHRPAEWWTEGCQSGCTRRRISGQSPSSVQYNCALKVN